MTDRLNTGTVGVEHSDERLAAVEEAKRTGNEFRSVGAKGVDLVAREKVERATREQSTEGASETSTLPSYLEELQENLDFGDYQRLNNEKAQEHNEYSAELVARQQEENAEALENIKNDRLYYVKRIDERNHQQAHEHEEQATKYAEAVGTRENKVAQEIQVLTTEQAFDRHPVTALGQRAEVTDISESSVRQGLEEKDRIIYGEESFKAEAKRTSTAKPSRKRRAEKPSKENVSDRDTKESATSGDTNQTSE